jgi:hypothetical protein
MDETAKVEQTNGPVESLAQIEERFSGWREGRKPGERIPAALWAAAVGMAKEHGVYRISRQLHLDYRGLRQRLERAGGVVRGGKPEARFVELCAAPVPNAAGLRECVVELENGRGAKMRVELNAAGLAGLAHLCSAFWGAA